MKKSYNIKDASWLGNCVKCTNPRVSATDSVGSYGSSFCKIHLMELEEELIKAIEAIDKKHKEDTECLTGVKIS